MNIAEFEAELAANTPGMSLEDLFNDLKLATVNQSRERIASDGWKIATAEINAMKAEITARCSR